MEKAWEHNVEIHQIFVDFQKAYDSIRRDKLYAIMEHFGIPNKLIRLTKATMENSTYYLKIGTIMTDGFKVGTGLEQGVGLAPSLFNIALEYVVSRGSVRSTRGLGPTMTARGQSIGISIGMLPQTLIMSRLDQLSRLGARI